MRRITIYIDEDAAKDCVAYLELQGVDYMSEDYAEPTLLRRPPPTRRPAPERHEPSGGFLTPKLRPTQKSKSGRKRGLLANQLLGIITGAGRLPKEELQQIAADNGWRWKQCADTLARLVKAREIGADRRSYWKA